MLDSSVMLLAVTMEPRGQTASKYRELYHGLDLSDEHLNPQPTSCDRAQNLGASPTRTSL
jgi:hypothetical protein